MIAVEQIEEFAQRIGEEFHPERIFLFGSYANGVPTRDSDVDILVVLPHNTRGHRVATQIRGRVRPPFPLDLLVRTPEEVEKRIEMGDDFIRDIVEEGRVLYEGHHG